MYKMLIFVPFVYVFTCNNYLTENKPRTRCYLPYGYVDEPSRYEAFIFMQLKLQFPGDEVWLPLVGYEKSYQVSSFGRVRSIDRKVKHNRYGGRWHKTKGRILKIYVDKRPGKGYCHVGLPKNGKMRTLQVHRLIALTFIPNPLNKPEVNHKNLIHTDNRVDNLEWATRKENAEHAVLNGCFDGINKGENQGRAKLSDKEAHQIKEFLKNGRSGVSLAREFNVSEQTICDIKKGRIRR